MIINKEIKMTLEGLGIDRISSPSGEVLWIKPKIIFLEYLQSTGTLYIDTGILGDMDLQFKTKLVPVNTQEDSTFFGYYRQNPNSNSASQLNRFHFGKKIPGVGYPAGGTSLTAFVNNQEYIATYSNKIFTIGGESVDYFDRSISDPLSCYLFARHLIVGTTEGVGTHFSGKIYYFTIKDSSGLTIREFVPCDYNGSLGMYDVKNSKFYPNIGTGEFLGGPELHQVRFVDYIEATGTQYINSNYIPNSNTSIIAEWEYTNEAERAIYGNSPTLDNDLKLKGFRCLGGEGNAFNTTYIASGGTRALHNNTPLPSGKLLTVHKGNTFTYNGTTIASGHGNEFTPLMIAHDGYWDLTDEAINHRQEWFSGKIYSFLIKDGEVVVRDYRPCIYIEKPWLVNFPKKIGLWDLVSHKFYGNDGTGEFSAGKKILEFTDFLESDGDLYIKTGLIANDNLEFKTKVIPVGTNESNVTFFGWINGASNRYHFGLTTPGVGNLALAGMGLFIDNTTYNFEYSGHILKVNDFTKDFTDKTVIDGLECYLFARNDAGTVTGFFKGLIYPFKSYRGNWLVRDFRPCVYKGESGMWDMVYDMFYGNSGAGEFVTNLDYTPLFVEYLISDGYLYIDTEYYPNENTGIQIKYECTYGSYVCGCRTDGSSFADSKYFGVTNSSDTHIIHCRLNAVSISEGLTYTEGETYLIDFNKDKCIINDSSDYYTGNAVPAYTSEYSMYLFNINYKGSPLPTWGNNKIYYVNILDGDTTVRLFKPCIYKKKIGMWEFIENKFYPNKGTGSFIAGPELYSDLNIVTDSSGNILLDKDDNYLILDEE